MGEPTLRRRDRLRAETIRDIKATALRHMSEGGPAAISLRAIAREMGMTAGALYSYYDTRGELINALAADVYNSLADAQEAARDSRPATDTAGRILAYGLAFREWAISNPMEFRLVYGDPVPGYQPPLSGPAPEAEQRTCALLTGLVADAWPAAMSASAGTDHQWSDFEPGFAALIRESFPTLPPAAIALALRVWGRMHGLVSLEVYGHLRAQTRDPAKLYRSEIIDLIRSLMLAPPG